MKLRDSIPVFRVENDITSKTPKQEEDETDYYPHDEVDEGIHKNWSNAPDNDSSGQTEQEQPKPTQIDVHQITAHGAT